MHAEDLDAVVEHNRPAAAMWSTGGDHYDTISFGIADALRHAVQRLAAKEGEEVLDVATGTGWAARLVARSGARVTGVDIAAGLIAAARHRSAHVMPRIEYRVADAERLPFADGRFDRVVSTFGVMFAGDHVRAARELARASAVSVDGSLWRPGRRTAQSPASSRCSPPTGTRRRRPLHLCCGAIRSTSSVSSAGNSVCASSMASATRTTTARTSHGTPSCTASARSACSTSASMKPAGAD